MSTLLDIQEAFRAGVLGESDALARSFIVEDEVPSDRRISIYRNNTLISLSKSLGACYPIVERLVGERFFDFVAQSYVKANPPEVPQLLAYGDGFGAFLDDFEAAQSVPYLGDVARLEWARNQALFADDAPVVSVANLQTVPADRYGRLRFRLHPSVRIVQSRWPVQSIWQVNQREDVAPVDLNQGGETVLVMRPGLKVVAHILTNGDQSFLTALSSGSPLEDAAEHALEADSEFDLQQALVAHLQRGTFCAVSLDQDLGTAK
ncbi:MAG: DNA-binding domain-containing protein [Pseudomonadota bacterium]